MQDVFPNIKSKPVHYNDLYFRLLACAIGSHIIVVYGEPNSTFEILLTPEYYYSFLGSFVIAIILFSVIRMINVRLDRHFDWKEKPLERSGLQLVLSMGIPGFLAFLMAFLFFRINGINIFKTTYLRYDFQFILLLLLLINCYYMGFYFFQRWRQAEKLIAEIATGNANSESKAVSTFQVTKGDKSLLLPIDEIAYVFRKADTNFLRTVNGEDFFINSSLDEAQNRLPDEKFFRANRQILLHRQVCRRFDLLSYGKLALIVNPDFKEEIVVSQKRAPEFKVWIEGQSL